MTWKMGHDGLRVALVERGALGAAFPNVACLPTKNMIYSARMIDLARSERPACEPRGMKQANLISNR